MLDYHKSLFVRDIMSRNPVATSPQVSVRETLRIMGTAGVGSVVIVEGHVAIGIFTERDLLRLGAAEDESWRTRAVGEVMTTPLITVQPEDPIEVAVQSVVEAGIRHLPVVDGGHLVGLLSSRDILQNWSRELGAQVTQRTRRLAAQYDLLEARTRERDHYMSVAAAIQKRLQPPREFEHEGLQVASAWLPCDEIGGDCFELVPHSDRSLEILLADVSGHSIPAALITSMIQAVYRGRRRGNPGPHDVLYELHRTIAGLLDNEFVTAIAAHYQPDDHSFSYARAGHPPGLHLSAATGEVHSMEAEGCWIGPDPDPHFELCSLTLEPFDRILLFSDGLNECRDEEGVMLGLEPLKRVLQKTKHQPVEAVRAVLWSLAENHRGQRGYEDDLTFMVIGRD